MDVERRLIIMRRVMEAVGTVILEILKWILRIILGALKLVLGLARIILLLFAMVAGKDSIMRLSRNMRKQRIRATKKQERVLRNIMAIQIKRRTKRQHPFDN
jgi:hypothetical protein